MKTIKIVNTYKENVWYKNDIGNVFQISDEICILNNQECYQVIQNEEATMLCININDCVIV